jgi:hypothetical protein
MPNTRKTYHYQEQQNRLTVEQLRILDESFLFIRELAQQRAIEPLGNLPDTAARAGHRRDPNIKTGNHQPTGTDDKLLYYGPVQ